MSVAALFCALAQQWTAIAGSDIKHGESVGGGRIVNVIPKGLNFNFMLPGLIEYIISVVVIGIAGGVIMRLLFSRLPRPISNLMINLGIVIGALVGLYVGSLLNP